MSKKASRRTLLTATGAGLIAGIGPSLAGATDEDRKEGERTPTAAFEITPEEPTAEETVTFDASASDAPAGDIEEYEWMLGENPLRSRAENGVEVEHTYDAPANYEVQLTVTDDDGTTDQTTKTIEVGEPTPTAAFEITPEEPTAEETVTFDASASDAPAGDIEEYEWMFGDDPRRSQSETGEEVEHTYDAPANYEVQLTVTDDDGTTDQTRTTLEVEPGSPTAAFNVTPESPVVGETVSFDASASDAPGGDIEEYEWRFGDTPLRAGGGSGEETEHSYDASANYTVQLTITDDDGTTDQMRKTIEVESRERPPSSTVDPDVFDVVIEQHEPTTELTDEDVEAAVIALYNRETIDGVEMSTDDVNGLIRWHHF